MTDFVSWGSSSVVIATVLGLLGWGAVRSRRPLVGHVLYVIALLELITPPLIPMTVWHSPDLVLAPDVASAEFVATATGVSNTPSIVGLPWWMYALGAWSLGSVVALLLAISRICRFQRWVRGLREASSSVQQDVERLAARLGLRRAPQALVTESAVSPMLCPTVHGLRIVLPAPLLAQISHEARQTLLLHELAHVRRRDWLVRFVELAAVIVWWWMPITYLLRRGLRRAEELCCDAWVLVEFPDLRCEYGNLLITAAAPPFSTHALACSLSPKQLLENRIRMLDREPTSPSLGAASRLLAFAVAALLLPIAACRAPTRVTVVSFDSGGRVAYLMGAVEAAVEIDLANSTATLLETIEGAKLTDDADLTRVHLVKPGPCSWLRLTDGAPTPWRETDRLALTIDARAMIETGDMNCDVAVEPGDIVYVPRHSEPLPAIQLPQRSSRVLANKSSIEAGDLVSCLIDEAVLRQPGCERLRVLTQLQRIGRDGSILVPFVGSLRVVGLQTSAVETLLEQRLSEFFALDLEIQVRASEGR